MFMLDEEPTFETDLDISAPGNRKMRIRATFRVLPVDRVEELMRELARGGDEGRAAVDAMVDEAWVGWKDVIDREKKPVEFSRDRLHALMQLPYVRHAFLEQYPREIGGQARRKN